ncbi:MAG: ATP-binding cassette domain-containing protein [Gemmatimonadaceae bacterium]
MSIEIAPGECVALIGESGSGKTTLLRSFNRMVEPTSGRVLVDGEDTRALDAITLRRRIGYVPQDGGLMPHWRIRRNVSLVPRLRAMPDADALADAALRLAGLDPARFATRWPRELSGGQRQRASIARALAARPAIVLMDEPFGALDAITRSELRQSFRALRRELAVTTVIVTHDLHEAIELADRIAVLRAGRIEQFTDPARLVASPGTEYVATLLARAGVTS